MRRAAVIGAFTAMALGLSACMDGVKEGEKQYLQIQVEQVSEERFAVSIEALNVDGYQLARCVAAAYTDALRDDESKRLHDFYIRDGGKLVDEFRLSDGVRNQRTSGIQTYSFAKGGEHDGRDVMSVDLQLATCERQDLPTKLGES